MMFQKPYFTAKTRRRKDEMMRCLCSLRGRPCINMRCGSPSMDKIFFTHLHADHTSDLTHIYCFGHKTKVAIKHFPAMHNRRGSISYKMVPSIILFTIARIQLGGSFQVSAEANKLVKTGIYKKVRHPIYLFGIIFLSGIIFMTHTLFLLIIVVIVIIFQIKRIKQEEKMLAEKFGNEFSAYKKQTWF
jgi:phosphoribosyl 1,2-cyclic phosphodiesterase